MRPYLLLELHDDPFCAIFELPTSVFLLLFQRGAKRAVGNALPGVATVDLREGGREGGKGGEDEWVCREGGREGGKGGREERYLVEGDDEGGALAAE